MPQEPAPAPPSAKKWQQAKLIAFAAGSLLVCLIATAEQHPSANAAEQALVEEAESLAARQARIRDKRILERPQAQRSQQSKTAPRVTWLDTEFLLEQPKPQTAITDLAIPEWGHPQSCSFTDAPEVTDMKQALLEIREGHPAEGLTVTRMLARCDVRRRALAQAYNTGGLSRFFAGESEAAAYLWADAVVADRSHLTSRFNLATALTQLGHDDTSIDQLIQLAKAGHDGRLWNTRTLDDTDFKGLWQRSRYWGHMLDTGLARHNILHVKGPERSYNKLPPPPLATTRWAPMRGAWKALRPLIHLTLGGARRTTYDIPTSPRYPDPVRRGQPEHLVVAGWWRPERDALYLVVPYQTYSDTGLGIFRANNGSLRLAHQAMLVEPRDCDRPLTQVAITADADEIRTVEGCKQLNFCRYRHLAGELTRVCTDHVAQRYVRKQFRQEEAEPADE